MERNNTLSNRFSWKQQIQLEIEIMYYGNILTEVIWYCIDIASEVTWLHGCFIVLQVIIMILSNKS